MCLQVDENYPKQENGAIRYKVLHCNKRKKKLTSPYFDRVVWNIGKLKRKSIRSEKIDDKGFHVFVEEHRARNFMFSSVECLVECECFGFVAGGCGQEIWKKVLPVKIIDTPNWFKITTTKKGVTSVKYLA